MMTNTEYVRAGGTLCPACGSCDISCVREMEMDEGAAQQKVKCDDCNSTWLDHYDLIGFTNLVERAVA